MAVSSETVRTCLEVNSGGERGGRAYVVVSFSTLAGGSKSLPFSPARPGAPRRTVPQARPSKVRGAKKNERHVCGRARAGERSVSYRCEHEAGGLFQRLLIDEANAFKRDHLSQAGIELKEDRTKYGRS